MARRLLLLFATALQAVGAERSAAFKARFAPPPASAGASRDAAASAGSAAAGAGPASCSVPPELLVGGALPALVRIPVSITSCGRARTFLLVLPRNSSAPLPLLLALSGALDDASILLNASGVYPDGPSSAHVDVKATAAGFAVLAPNSLCNSPVLNGTCVWGSTTTPLDPAHVAGEVLTPTELTFFIDAARCVRDVLRVPLSGDVYTLGFSQGGKLASRFGCEGAGASGGELRVRAVAAAEALYAAQPAQRGSCAAGAADANPPPLLLFQAQNDTVVPFCTAAAYDATAVYWATWAGAYAGCMPSAPVIPDSGAISPPIMQALCAPDAPTLPTAAATPRSAYATRLLRVYTNGLNWCATLRVSM